MTNRKEITAGIIIIGNEVLSGRTKDINTSTLAKWLNSLGIEVKEVRTIPDLENIIIETVNSLREKFDYIFTTGGIGPTHDDITAKSIAKAFKVKYGYHNEAYKILENYYGKEKFNDGRKKMAKMPIIAKLIYNPSSAAPGFITKNVFSLPGVPSILNSMIENCKKYLIKGLKVHSNTINLFTVESNISKQLENIQKKYKKFVEIGSYPFFRLGKIGVSVVSRSTSQIKLSLVKKELLKVIKSKKIKVLNI